VNYIELLLVNNIPILDVVFFKLRFLFWSNDVQSTGNRNGTGQIALQDQSWTNKSDLIVDGRNQPETLKP